MLGKEVPGHCHKQKYLTRTSFAFVKTHDCKKNQLNRNEIVTIPVWLTEEKIAAVNHETKQIKGIANILPKLPKKK